MTETVNRVTSSETKRFRQRMQGDALVDKEMRASLEAEEARYRRERTEFQQHMQQVKQKKRVEKELKDVAQKLKKARKANREAQAVLTAKESIK